MRNALRYTLVTASTRTTQPLNQMRHRVLQAPANQGYSGNQAILRRFSSTTPRLQYKLEIGSTNDPLEAEADLVADHLMDMSDADVTAAARRPALRRKCAACEEEDLKTVRTKRTGQSQGEGEAPPIVHEVLGSPGQPLDGVTRGFFEARFGYDFSPVRIHADARAAQSAGAVNALAYTVGHQIVLGAGAKPGATPLLAHELTHVVQQGGGGSAGSGSTAIRPKLQRQPADAPSLSMPAFPCDRGAGIELCNFTTDSTTAPNFQDCFQKGKDVIDACPGDENNCLPASKCATCACLGRRYCQCTGIV
jgi:hypothetical protein